MNRRAIAAAGWLLLVFIAFGPLAPTESRPDQSEWIWRLLSGQWEGENVVLVALFQCMGIWPMLMVLRLRAVWTDPGRPAWPFLGGAFVLGCFALLPWFAWTTREEAPAPPASRGAAALSAVLGASALGLLGWGAFSGDAAGFLELFRSDAFVWAMSWDFVAFWLLAACLAPTGSRFGRGGWWLPLVGPAAAMAVDGWPRGESA